MILRYVYLLICGLLLAGIIHISIILLIPVLGSRDAGKQIMNTGTTGFFQTISDDASLGISDIDPFFETSVCRYSLEGAGMRFVAPKTPLFWSASIFDRNGRVVYSFNDRTAIGSKLDLILVNPVQMADLRESKPEEIETSIVFESSAREGFFLLRALARDTTEKSAARAFLQTAGCAPFQTR